MTALLLDLTLTTLLLHARYFGNTAVAGNFTVRARGNYAVDTSDAANPITSREVNEAWRPRTCSRPCAFEEIKAKKKITKPRRTQNTPRNPQQPGDRNHLEMACDETRSTR